MPRRDRSVSPGFLARFGAGLQQQASRSEVYAAGPIRRDLVAGRWTVVEMLTPVLPRKLRAVLARFGTVWQAQALRLITGFDCEARARADAGLMPVRVGFTGLGRAWHWRSAHVVES